MTAPDSEREEEAARPDTEPTDGLAARAELEAKTREYEDLFDKYMRLLAEFDNYKKRTAKERDQYQQFANEEFLKEWLPIIDNMDRALRHARESQAPPAVVEGWALVLKQAHDLLARAGVTPIDSVGAPFNPEFHQAIAQRETDDAEEGTVIEEAQRGYVMNGRLLRPALVTVAKPGPVAGDGTDDAAARGAHRSRRAQRTHDQTS